MAEIDRAINNLRNLGDHLVPYNFPLKSTDFEPEVAALKTMDRIDADGYTVSIYYSKAYYAEQINYYLEVFQVFGYYSPFLPFNLVIKLAKKALGSENLSLAEFYQDGHKVYCWTVYRDLDGNSLAMQEVEEKIQHKIYEGFEYGLFNPGQVDFH